MAAVKYKTWAELQKHNEEARKRRELEQLEKIKKEEEEKKTEEEVQEVVVPQEKKVSKGRKPKNRAYMGVEEIPTPVIEGIKEEEKEEEKIDEE